MLKDTLAHRAMALALLLPLATLACADEGMEEDLDTDFETTEPGPEVRGEQFDLEERNDSGVEGEGWARVEGGNLVVTLSFEDPAAPQDLSLFVHRGTCGDEAAPQVTEMQRDMAATGTTPGSAQGDEPATPGEDAAAGTADDPVGQTRTAGPGMTFTAPLSALHTGAPMAGDVEDGEAEIGGTEADEMEFSIRAHPAAAGATATDAEDDEGQGLFCGDLPSEVLEDRAGAGTPGTTTPQDDAR